VEALLDSVAIGGKPGPKKTRFEAIGGDKAYDSQAIRKDLRKRGTKPVIAHRKNRQGEYPPEAVGFDKALYRQRNVVERLIGRLKENRRIATRYEKQADSYRAMILLAFIRIWLKSLLSYTP
jgi:transposase